MSTVYVLEPPTKGKVILTTSKGPIDIELWPKEAPKAVRNFVQLCLEGYYNNTVFHRVIKSFLIQGGDPTGTGEGGESIYGSGFPDEFHSRLRFKHRGLVACAGVPETPNSNGSQFFMTLDRCDWLDKKHTIFGKVTGDSIYNLLHLGEVETDTTDRPLDPLPKILSVEVLWNPFEDIVPRVIPVKSSLPSEKKEPKQKVTKKLNLLSFGEEAEEEEKELAAVNPRIKSSHDVLNDPRLLKDGSEKDSNSIEAQKSRDSQLMVREALSKKEHKEELGRGHSDSPDHSDDDEVSFDARMRQQILRRKQELVGLPTKKDLHNERVGSEKRAASPPRSSAGEPDERPKADKLSLKKKGIGSEARAERLANADADLQLLGEAERARQLNKQKKRRRQGHEEDVLAKLDKFKSAFSTKFKGSNSGDAADKEEDVSGWMGVELKFAPERGKTDMSRSEDPNDYVVHDPLLEKGKEKFNRMQAKEKRRQREWAGKSLT
ncbi:Cyclophilin-like peptidyl-prolyl cis-trans isomerase family protein [Perilla frutescens var. hirtella]|uniref:Cyclophilin-like peptidyl-prolyl cis-trans isomerase family protein n=1 Tax=Perilla frutescens var. hirtella TaxID=608512 RepID=A0AAD4J773_PERFH|nr:Cyclophilin-like peptidyl-prolyl cis-trans isomerase family protein [Perilla frutescens var. hirtella]